LGEENERNKGKSGLVLSDLCEKEILRKNKKVRNDHFIAFLMIW
jgi:hypothetical protein